MCLRELSSTDYSPRYQQGAKVRSQKAKPGGWQKPSYMTQHHFFPGSEVAGSWSQEPAVGIEPIYFEMRCQYHN